MGRKSTAPTMKDVAAEAGVALGTVSKVVNGIPVGKAYQKRVEAAIDHLGYRINSYAQGLKANKTCTIALLIPNTINPFFGALVYHINRLLAERGYRTLLCSTDADLQTERELFDMAQQNKADGIISLTYNESLNFEGGAPLVTIDRHIDPAVPCVSSDNFAGGRLAAETLVSLGCRSLVFLGRVSPRANEVLKRCDGFRSTCSAMEVAHEILTVHDGTPFSAFSDFLDSRIENGVSSFDGIFCINDHLAVQVVRHLRQNGLRVPEDVQVIGFDGLRDYFTGELLCSTIIQPVEQIAAASVDLVLTDRASRPASLICLPVTYGWGGTTLR